jgi:hypothetical protein
MSNELNDLMIDIAVLCQELTSVDVICNDANITEFDEIAISKEIFKKIFYPHGEIFGVDKSVANGKQYYEYITFLSPFRTVNNKLFILLEQIIKNIETDLNISRSCFTTTSTVELTNEILNIKTLCDLNCCSILNSLSWTNIEDIIENYKMLHKNNSHQNLLLVISVVFRTPTEGVKNTIIKFKYRITNDK